jgi:hypothetical protein
MVSSAERSATEVVVTEMRREEKPHGIDLDGHCAGLARDTVIAMAGPSQIVLKARLSKEPVHPRALATLLEAVALWQGQPVRAALFAAGAGSTSASKLYRETFLDDGGALFSVVWVPAGAARPRERLTGLGSFRDLERLVIEEVAR